MKAKKDALDDAINATKPQWRRASYREADSHCSRLRRARGDRNAMRGRRADRSPDPAASARSSRAANRGKLGGRWRRRRQQDVGGLRQHRFDASRKQYVDLFEAGIVDPTKVVRIAIQNAVSVASILLLTEATMTEKPEQKQQGRRR